MFVSQFKCNKMQICVYFAATTFSLIRLTSSAITFLDFAALLLHWYRINSVFIGHDLTMFALPLLQGVVSRERLFQCYKI